MKYRVDTKANFYLFTLQTQYDYLESLRLLVLMIAVTFFHASVLQLFDHGQSCSWIGLGLPRMAWT